MTSLIYTTKTSSPKQKLSRCLELLVGLLTVILLTYLILWRIDAGQINRLTEDIAGRAQVREINDDDETKLIDQGAKLANKKLIDADLIKLRLMNNQAVGWLEIEGTDINYPLVQTNNNEYYLNHLFNQTPSATGWPFVDYRNNLSSNDQQTIIYVHSRFDQVVFSPLRHILTSGWFEVADNHFIRLSTDYEDSLWQVFSIYHASNNQNYQQINFSSDDQFSNFSNQLGQKSIRHFTTTVSSQDRLLTITTDCGFNNQILIHAKLVKSRPKK